MLPFVGPHAFADPTLDFQDLLAGVDQRPLQPVDFLRRFRLSHDRFSMVGFVLVQHKSLPRHTPAETGMPRKICSPAGGCLACRLILTQPSRVGKQFFLEFGAFTKARASFTFT